MKFTVLMAYICCMWAPLAQFNVYSQLGCTGIGGLGGVFSRPQNPYTT